MNLENTATITPMPEIASRNIINRRDFGPEELPDAADFTDELYDGSLPRPFICSNSKLIRKQNRYFIKRWYEKRGIPEGWGAD